MSSTTWARLRDGNARWAAGCGTADDGRGAVRRAQLTDSQSPFAVILGCADSRVPAEILFDQGLGDLFVVRTAGHVLDGAVLGSVEYAVALLGVPLIVVLGHEGCGAVAAATRLLDNGEIPPGHIRDLAERVTPHVLRARNSGATTPRAIGAQHALYTVDLLRQHSAIIDNAVRRGTLATVAAQYGLCTGLVEEIPAHQLIAA